MEDLNETIVKAYSKNRFSETIAIPMFKEMLQKKEHENLISLLMTEEEISRFKNELQKWEMEVNIDVKRHSFLLLDGED